MTFLFEIINLSFIIILLFLFITYWRFDLLKSLILFFHIVTIFCLNYVLFSPSYMPDQKIYFNIANSIRTSFVFPNDLLTPTGIVGTFYAIFPIPFINSVYSIAMVNFILYLFLFWCLGKWKMFNNTTVFFFLLYPSLLLYSSVGLREVIILLLMIISVQFFVVQERFFLSFIIAIPLLLFRIQNFAIVIMSFFIFMFLSEKLNFRKVILIFSSIFLFLIVKDFPISRFTLGEFFTLEKLEFYREAFYNEELRIGKDVNYYPISGVSDFIWVSSTNFFYMMFKPFPWESTNILQLFQSFENLIVIGIILWLNKTKIYEKVIKRKKLFLNIFLVVSMTVYGMVVFNYGSAARYRFSFLTIYFLFYFYFLYLDKITLKNKFKIYENNFLNSQTVRTPI